MSFQFATISDFMVMGGHGAFVWASYLITLSSILALIVVPSLQKRRLVSQLKRRQRIAAVAAQKSSQG